MNRNIAATPKQKSQNQKKGTATSNLAWKKEKHDKNPLHYESSSPNPTSSHKIEIKYKDHHSSQAMQF